MKSKKQFTEILLQDMNVNRKESKKSNFKIKKIPSKIRVKGLPTIVPNPSKIDLNQKKEPPKYEIAKKIAKEIYSKLMIYQKASNKSIQKLNHKEKWTILTLNSPSYHNIKNMLKDAYTSVPNIKGVESKTKTFLQSKSMIYTPKNSKSLKQQFSQLSSPNKVNRNSKERKTNKSQIRNIGFDLEASNKKFLSHIQGNSYGKDSILDSEENVINNFLIENISKEIGKEIQDLPKLNKDFLLQKRNQVNLSPLISNSIELNEIESEILEGSSFPNEENQEKLIKLKREKNYSLVSSLVDNFQEHKNQEGVHLKSQNSMANDSEHKMNSDSSNSVLKSTREAIILNARALKDQKNYLLNDNEKDCQKDKEK